MTGYGDFALMMARLDLEKDAAVATGLLLDGGDVDGYLASVGYSDRLAAFKAAGGVL